MGEKPGEKLLSLEELGRVEGRLEGRDKVVLPVSDVIRLLHELRMMHGLAAMAISDVDKTGVRPCERCRICGLCLLEEAMKVDV